MDTGFHDEVSKAPLGDKGGSRVSDVRAASEDPSETKSVIMSFDGDPEFGTSRSPTSVKEGSPSARESILKEPGHHDGQKRVTMSSDTSDAPSHPDQDRGPTPDEGKKHKKSSKRQTELTYDVVVEKETDPEFVAGLHDLTKEKFEAHDILVQEITSTAEREDRYDKKKETRRTPPWRKNEKTASRANLLDEKMGDRSRLGVKLRNKTWVPTVVNPLEIDLRKSQKKELKEVFEIMEDPRAGMVAVDDISVVARACGSEPTQELIEDIVKKIEPVNTGYLSPEEFEDILRYRLEVQDPTEEIERAFKMMSGSWKDRVGLEDLRDVSKLVDYPLTDDELMEMINAACPTGSGAHREATLGGFMRLMTSPNWYDAQKVTRRKQGKKSTFKQDRVYRQISPSAHK